MRYSKVITLIALFILSSFTAYSQGGNNYTIFGIGEIQSSSSAVYEGLGGTSIAVPSPSGITSLNPAMWSFVNTTRIQASYKFNQHMAETDQDVIYQNNGKVNGITGMFSIDTSMGISLGFGLKPYSVVNYYIGEVFIIDTDGFNTQGRNEYTGIGGLNQAYIGGSVKLFDELALGFKTYAIFGQITSTIETDMWEQNFFNATNQKIDNFVGFGFTLGASVEPVDNLLIGTFFEKNNRTELRRKTIFSSQLLGDTSYTTRSYINMPMSYGFGASYRTGKFLLATDLLMANYDDLEYQNPANGNFKNSMSLSFGVERTGDKSRSRPYLDRCSYRFGISYKDLYYSLRSEDIKEYAASFGMMMPLPGKAQLDFGFKFGQRGTTNNGLINEYFGKMTIDISIGETWFKPFKREF